MNFFRKKWLLKFKNFKISILMLFSPIHNIIIDKSRIFEQILEQSFDPNIVRLLLKLKSFDIIKVFLKLLWKLIKIYLVVPHINFGWILKPSFIWHQVIYVIVTVLHFYCPKEGFLLKSIWWDILTIINHLFLKFLLIKIFFTFSNMRMNTFES